MSEIDEYNPLDYTNLTVNLVRELMDRGPDPLPPEQRFLGAGVYALFYTGSFAPYAAFRSPQCDHPIYVGKAVLGGARKGGGTGDQSAGAKLYGRLREHSRSIEQANNLELSDFRCRFLVVTPLWITMAERFLIENFQPVWNVAIDGFGGHATGSGRYEGQISWWDALHPGRGFAALLKQSRTQAESFERLSAFAERLTSDPESVRSDAARVARESSMEEE